MATANTTAAPEEPCVKPAGDAAMADLCKFISIAKENPHALTILNEYVREERPVIDAHVSADHKPQLFLAAPLASFLRTKVAA